jgi:hypothetical protein
MAWLGVERNNNGLTVVKALLKRHRYTRMYWAKRIQSERESPEDRAGWITNTVTKPVMEQGIREVHRDELIDSRSLARLEEMLTYVKAPNGKTGGRGANHDDRVIGFGIAVQVHISCPFDSKPVDPVRQWDSDVKPTERRMIERFERGLLRASQKRARHGIDHQDPRFRAFPELGRSRR